MQIAVFDRMEECSEAEVQRMLPLVSAQRREQALRYKHTVGQFCCLKSWLRVKGLMDEGISGLAGEWISGLAGEGISGLADEWEYNEYGKPYIKGGLHFSISHCKAGIAVAVDEQPIGIDIEAIRHAEDDLIERVMNEEERKQIHNDRAFTRLWTQKEAIVKAQGVGLQSFEQLQGIRIQDSGFRTESFESENYIYSIAHK